MQHDGRQDALRWLASRLAWEQTLQSLRHDVDDDRTSADVVTIATDADTERRAA